VQPYDAVGNLTAIEERMASDVNVFKDRFSEILRQAAANLRPMARVEYILPLQGRGACTAVCTAVCTALCTAVVVQLCVYNCVCTAVESSRDSA
jgi:phosphoserine phosphatase